MKQSRPAAGSAPDPFFSILADEDADDRKRARAAVIGAAIVHAAILFVTFPTLYTDPLPPPEPRNPIRLVAAKPYTPPPPRTPELPKTNTRQVPVPDPTPHDAEPYVADVPETPEIAPVPVDPLGLAIPAAPPALPIDDGPILIAGDVVAPVRVGFVPPTYTEVARRARVEGSVILGTVVDRQGRVGEIRVLKSLPFGLTDQAVAALRRWTFEPATLDGKPVDVFYNVTIHFNLD